MKFLSLFFFILLAASASSAQSSIDLRIDTTYALGANASQLFEEITFTTLKMPEKSNHDLLVNNLEVSKNYYIITDQTLKAVLVFNRQGDLLTTIDKLPIKNWNPKKDRIDEIGHSVDYETEVLYFYYEQREEGKKNLYSVAITMQGETKEIKKIPLDITQMVSPGLLKLAGDNLLCFNVLTPQEQQTDTTVAGIYIFNTKKLSTTPLLPWYNGHTYERFLPPYFITGATGSFGVTTTKQYNYRVAYIDNTARLNWYNFIFPQHMSLPPLHTLPLTNNESKNATIFSDFSAQGKVMFVSDVIPMDNLISFKLNKYWGKEMGNFLFSTTSNRLYKLEKIRPDSLSHNLPFLNRGITTAHENYFYTSMPSYMMQKESNHQVISQNGTVTVQTSNPVQLGNHIIIQLKPRKNL